MFVGNSLAGLAASIRALFANGEQGAWYDPSDLSTLFQDSAGTTPVTAVEQPVGLMLDKRQGPTLGPELRSAGAVGLVGTATAATYDTTTGAGTVDRVNGSNQSFVQWSSLSTNYYVVTISCTSGTNILVRSGGPLGTTIASVLVGNSTTVYLTPNANLITINSGGGSAGFTVSSFKELPGNHAYQATSANRPVLSARVNLLTSTATLATQSVTTVATNYKLYFTGTGSITLSGTATGTYSAGTNTITCTAGTLTLTVSGAVSTADLRASNEATNIPAYQRVNTSTDYDTVGFPLYIKPNGSSQSMRTNSIDFSATDKMTVWSGQRKLTDDALAVVSELSGNIANNNGTFLLSAPNSAAANLNFSSKGTTQVDNTVTTYTAPLTNVIAASADIAAPNNSIIINGGSATTVTSTQGTGKYGNFPLYLFARYNTGTTSNWFSGRLYGLIIRGASSSSMQIERGNTYLNVKVGKIYG